LRFVSKTLDEMGKFPEMKGFYLIMDNAPIHTSKEVEEMVVSRCYNCDYLPPYSIELNPIEQFGS
jgi:transposase